MNPPGKNRFQKCEDVNKMAVPKKIKVFGTDPLWALKLR
jgi:hypothetical protein